MRILVLGGTGEARELANRLVAMGHHVITSLAGRTNDPLLPEGSLRVGKFGGIPGLVAYLKATRIDRLVDATHPYAGLISVNAVAAAERAGIHLVRYMRPPWIRPEGANWTEVLSIEAAAAALPLHATVMLTTGHLGLRGFMSRDDCTFVVRLIEQPDQALPAHARLLIDRPPYTIEAETDLMLREGITQLVSKNAGGEQTRAKVEAANRLGIPTIMVGRPTYGLAAEAGTLDEAISLLHLSS